MRPRDGEGNAAGPAADLLDKRQQEVMARLSTDGRPPGHWLRTVEWRWLAILAGVLVVGVAAWSVWALNTWTILAGLALVVLMLVAASPVWGAGLLRGQEERIARKKAKAELRRNRKL